MSKNAFSLVELSIVLVILGLLSGGILAGKSLIRAAELRTISTQFTEYNIAMNTFKLKYYQTAGDMTNATKFWGAEPAANCPGDDTTPSTTTATCDGNGDGKIEASNSANILAGMGNERYRLWQHLANAGLITGTYTGVTGRQHAHSEDVTGENSPIAKLSSGDNTTFSIGYIGKANPGWPSYFEGEYGNAMIFGEANSGRNLHEVITPSEAWKIDKKIDDSHPGKGRVVVNELLNDCHTNSDPDLSEYDLQNDEINCNLIWRRIVE